MSLNLEHNVISESQLAYVKVVFTVSFIFRFLLLCSLLTVVSPIISFRLFFLFCSFHSGYTVGVIGELILLKAAKIQSQRLTRVLCVISSLKLYATEVTHHHNQESLYFLFNNKTEKFAHEKHLRFIFELKTFESNDGRGGAGREEMVKSNEYYE